MALATQITDRTTATAATPIPPNDAAPIKAFRPGSELIAHPIHDGVDEALRLVAVLARHDGEQHLARRTGDRKIPGPSQDLEADYSRERWGECEHPEPDDAEERQARKRDADARAAARCGR